jgi:hypothetical protein
MENYEITKELRESVLDFLTNYENYEKNLELLKNQEKTEFSEEEINSLLNLLGKFRLSEIYQLVERFRIEVTPLKSQQSDRKKDTVQAG